MQTPDPEGALRKLIDNRSPTYALADVSVASDDSPHEMLAAKARQALISYLNVPLVPCVSACKIGFDF